MQMKYYKYAHSVESQQGSLLRLSQLSISLILNLIDAEVLIKIRIATSHC